MTQIHIYREPDCRDIPLPEYHSEGASGMDLRAAVEGEAVLNPGEFRLVSAGIRVMIPAGFEAQVRPRSGLALRHGISVLNTPGTIDSDYRGVVGVILVNFSQKAFTIKRGDRIAQMVITSVTRAAVEEVMTIEATIRNDGGFGHTGI